MTPARLAEIRAYIQRLDLDQLPGWTIEQRIIADLWDALQDAENVGAVKALRDAADDIPGLPREGFIFSVRVRITSWLRSRADEIEANPYRVGPP